MVTRKSNRGKAVDVGGDPTPKTRTRKKKVQEEEIPFIRSTYAYPCLDEALQDDGIPMVNPYKEKKIQLPKWLPQKAYQPPFSFSSPVDVAYPKPDNPGEKQWVSGYRIFNPLQELKSRVGLKKRQYKAHVKDKLSKSAYLGVVAEGDLEGKVIAIIRDHVRPHGEGSIPSYVFFDTLMYREKGFIQLQGVELAEKEDLALGLSGDHVDEQVEIVKDDD